MSDFKVPKWAIIVIVGVLIIVIFLAYQHKKKKESPQEPVNDQQSPAPAETILT